MSLCSFLLVLAVLCVRDGSHPPGDRFCDSLCCSQKATLVAKAATSAAERDRTTDKIKPVQSDDLFNRQRRPVCRSLTGRRKMEVVLHKHSSQSFTLDPRGYGVS